MNFLRRLLAGLRSVTAPATTVQATAQPQPARREIIGRRRTRIRDAIDDNARTVPPLAAADRSPSNGRKRRSADPTGSSPVGSKRRRTESSPLVEEVADSDSDPELPEDFIVLHVPQSDGKGRSEGGSEARGWAGEDRSEGIDAPHEGGDERREQANKKTTIVRFADPSPSREAAYLSRGVGTANLRAAGWEEDHIVLVQKLAMRGSEPLLPHACRWGMRHLPDALFARSDDAFISSERLPQYHAERAVSALFQMGGLARAGLESGGRPERQIQRCLDKFWRYTMQDAKLDVRAAIPTLAFEYQPADVDAHTLKENARRKMARLADRFAAAFEVYQSIETTPARSPFSTVLSHPIPTLYCIVASHTAVGLVAYRARDAEPATKNVAIFDFGDKDYDVWNALALAMVLCHTRNVMLQIAEETGLGARTYNADHVDSSPDA